MGAVPAVLGDPYLERVRLAELSGLSPGTWHVHTTLSDALGRLVASQVTSVELRTAQVATIVIDRDCGGVECPSIEEDPSRASCIGGECGPATCTEETPSGCPVECTVDADCPSSRCASGRCSVGVCLLAPTSGACAADEWCDPDVGCAPLEIRDAGTRDAGRDAGAPDAGPLDAGRDAGSPCGFAMCRSDGLPCGTCGSSTTTFGAIADLTLPGGVYELESFSIAEGVTVTVTGTEPLQIRSRGAVRIAGALVLDGSSGEGVVCTASGLRAGGAGGPGGGAGGTGGVFGAAGDPLRHGTTGEGPGGGGGGSGELGAAGGGGGGGSATDAQPGTDGRCISGCGCGTSVSPAGVEGAAYDAFADALGPRGSGGGGGGFGSRNNGLGAGGGGGGGGLSIIAPTIEIGGTVRARGGDGGDGAAGDGGAGGGGSGGSVWLRASRVTITGSIDLSGGAGGAAGMLCNAPGAGGDGAAGQLRIDALEVSGAPPSAILGGAPVCDGAPCD